MDTQQKVSIPTGTEMSVSGNPRKLPKYRKGAVFGPLLTAKRYILHNTSMVNTVRGILERVFYVVRDGKLVPPTEPKPNKFGVTLLSEFRALTSGPKFLPLSIENTVSLWVGRKRKLYESALRSLAVKPLTREDGCLKTFVKCEKIDASKIDPAPRVIQPRDARYNLHLASFIKHVEHEYYARVDRMFDTDGLGDRTIFKGLNSKAAADHMVLKASRYSNPVFVGLDASRFDQHVSLQALEWEHSIYLANSLGDRKLLARLLSWQAFNIGKALLHEGSIQYRVKGRRMSGDMNTSLGNCIIMCSMVRAFMRRSGVPKFSLANNGDDCVLIFERTDLPKIKQLSSWFANMGFDMKQDPPVYDIRNVKFCQIHVLTSPNYNLCVRDPNVAMSKDLHSAYPFTHQGQYDQWLTASGICGRSSHGGVPVLNAFYQCFPSVEVTDKNILAELNTWRKYGIVGGSSDVEISDEMRHSFWVAFGITPDAQIALESLLSTVNFGTSPGDVTAVPYVSYLQGNI